MLVLESTIVYLRVAKTLNIELSESTACKQAIRDVTGGATTHQSHQRTSDHKTQHDSKLNVALLFILQYI